MDLARDLRTVPAADPPDPYLATAPGGGASLLDEIEAEVARDLSGGEVTYDVPGRPGWTVTYEASIDPQALGVWRKKAMTGGDLDPLKLACIILAACCRTIAKDGDPVTEPGPAGARNVTFGSRVLQEKLGVPTIPNAVEAVLRWYVKPGSILSTYDQLARAAGYDEQVSAVDPTGRSSNAS